LRGRSTGGVGSMGFKVKKNESVSAGTRRIARELVDEAVELIKEKEDPAETIQSPTDYAIMQTCPHTSHACRL